jgi:hypothetical protein
MGPCSAAPRRHASVFPSAASAASRRPARAKAVLLCRAEVGLAEHRAWDHFQQRVGDGGARNHALRRKSPAVLGGHFSRVAWNEPYTSGYVVKNK